MNLLSKNQLKNLAAYRQQKHCDEEGLFVVEGVKLCTEAVASDFSIRTVCMTNDFLSTAEGRSMAGRLEQRGCEITEVTDDQLERLSNQRTPNKVWMLVERHAVAPASNASQLTLALDRLQDPGNLGTILRSADWYGIRHVVCSRDTVSCYNPKVVQATMGAIFRTRIDYCDLVDYISAEKKKGTPVYGALLDGDSIYHSSLTTPAILVVGNEGRGISAAVASLVDTRLTIPNIGGTCESLNAATATAILLSEFCRCNGKHMPPSF